MSIREIITNKVIAAIEAGTPPWRQGWSGGGLAINMATGRPYQGINQILAGMSGYSDCRWLTFKQARKLGLHVRKGEKSTKIVRMVEVQRGADVTDGEVVEEGKETRLVMRLFDIFNASQIDGLEPLPAKEHAIQPVDVADAMVGGMKTTGLKVKHGYPGASYSILEDLVRMPEMANFHTTEDYYATIFHESIHSTGAPTRLGRPFSAFGSAAYAKEELRAEMGAAMLCAEVGIGQAKEHLDNHAAYIASWLEVLRQDKNEIFRAAADAQRACDYIREHATEVKPKLVQEIDTVPPQPIAAKRRGPRM